MATERDILINVKVKADEANAGLSEIQKAASSAGRQGKQELSKVTKEAADLGKATRDTGGKAKRMGKDIEESGIRALVALKQTGRGVFELARGLAFLSASNEDDLQKALRTIAKVQGAFDTFKGIANILRGMSRAIKALDTTTAAAVVTERAHATALGASAAAANAKTASMTRLSAATSTSNTALGTSAVVATAAGSQFAKLGGIIRGMARTRNVLAALVVGIALILATAKKTTAEMKLFSDALDEAFKLRTQNLSFISDLERRQILTSQLVDVEKTLSAVTRSRAENEQQQADKSRALVELSQARLNLQQQLKQLDDQAATKKRADLEAELDQRKQLNSQIQEQIKAERDRVASTQERFGRLTKPEQTEVAKLAQAVRGGTAGRASLSRLESLIGPQRAISEQFQQRGQGAFNVLQGVVDPIQTDLFGPQGAGAIAARNVAQLVEAIDRVGQAQAAANEETLKQMESLALQNEDFQMRMRQLERRQGQ